MKTRQDGDRRIDTLPTRLTMIGFADFAGVRLSLELEAEATGAQPLDGPGGEVTTAAGWSSWEEFPETTRLRFEDRTRARNVRCGWSDVPMLGVAITEAEARARLGDEGIELLVDGALGQLDPLGEVAFPEGWGLRHRPLWGSAR